MLNNNREDEYSKIEEGNGTENTKHTERKEFIKCSLIAAGVVIVLFSVVLSIYFAVTDKKVDNKVSAGTMRYSVIGFDPTTKKYSGGIYVPTEYTPSTSDFFDLYTVTDNKQSTTTVTMPKRITTTATEPDTTKAEKATQATQTTETTKTIKTSETTNPTETVSERPGGVRFEDTAAS